MHPTWLENPVVVRKANGKWRLCIDFTYHDKACPKDPFPLPRIDQIVDSTSGCDLISFLVRRGDGTLHKEQRSVEQHGRDHEGNFTQVRAAMRRKTLLLLCWIDGGKMVVVVACLPGRVASGRNGY